MNDQDKIYIVAVSGGVDSVSLLDILVGWQKPKSKKQEPQSQMINDKSPISHLPIPNYQLIVAHFDHGIRPESARDMELVRDLATQYSLKFETKRVELGPNASENSARIERYSFLNDLAGKYNGQIITAHHQDDVIETAIINLIRGTNRRGLASLASGEIIRPLLNKEKKELIEYAKQHDLIWNEDSTNKDTKYLRNYVRKNLTDKLTKDQKHKFVAIVESQKSLNTEIDKIITKILPLETDYEMSRYLFVSQEPLVSKELLYKVIKNLDSEVEISASLLENILWFIKSAKINKQFKLKNICFSTGKKGLISIKKS